eukprot:1710993-Prymnesium_polylepis.1
MTKDKLMQASGRMRLLDVGQTLVFVGNAEVTAKIKHVGQEAITLEEAILEEQRIWQRGTADASQLTARAIHQTLREEAQWSTLSLSDVKRARHEVTITSTSTRDRATIARAAVEVVALPTTTDLLRWVVQNTIRANHTALLAWARQGATFATT